MYKRKITKFFKQIFPRVLAVAESGWSDNSKDYNDFKQRVKYFLCLLDILDIPYTSMRSANPDIFTRIISCLVFYGNMIDKKTAETLKNFKNINMKVE